MSNFEKMELTIIICCFIALTGMISYRGGYETGQIDALKGKQLYHFVTNSVVELIKK